MSQKYPDSWREVLSTDGSELWHERRCGQYRVQRCESGEYVCWHSASGDGFGEVDIGTRPGLSAAMAHCREHLDSTQAIEPKISE